MIKELKIEGYRKFKSLHLKGLSNINIIVGPNNSGKSSVLEAISMLAGDDRNNLFASPELQYIYKYSASILHSKTDICKISAVTGSGDTLEKHIKKLSLKNEKNHTLRKRLVNEIINTYLIKKDTVIKQKINKHLREFYSIYLSQYIYNGTETNPKGLFDIKLFTKDTRISFEGKPGIYDLPFLLDPLYFSGKHNNDVDIPYPAVIHNFETVITHFYPNIPLYHIIYDKLITTPGVPVTDVLDTIKDAGGKLIRKIFFSPIWQDLILETTDNNILLMSSMGTGFVKLFEILSLLNIGRGGIVLLDEPTIALHPYYIDELAKHIAIMSADTQIFISTHNMQLIEMLLDTSIHDSIPSVLIRLNDGNGEVMPGKKAFNIMNDLYNDLLLP